MSDLISRQTAIDTVAKHFRIDNDLLEVIVYEMERLPSIQTEPCEDAVSRRRLLSDLKELTAAWGKYPVMAEQIKGVETAIGYVETIPSVTPEREKGKWIPCSERLPETHAVDVIEANGEKHVGFRLSKPVLGYAPGMDDEVEIATVWCEEDLNGSTSWITAPDCERVNVIAWMPLPEPYGGDQDDKN